MKPRTLAVSIISLASLVSCGINAKEPPEICPPQSQSETCDGAISGYFKDRGADIFWKIRPAEKESNRTIVHVPGYGGDFTDAGYMFSNKDCNIVSFSPAGDWPSTSFPEGTKHTVQSTIGTLEKLIQVATENGFITGHQVVLVGGSRGGMVVANADLPYAKIMFNSQPGPPREEIIWLLKAGIILNKITPPFLDQRANSEYVEDMYSFEVNPNMLNWKRKVVAVNSSDDWMILKEEGERFVNDLNASFPGEEIARYVERNGDHTIRPEEVRGVNEIVNDNWDFLTGNQKNNADFRFLDARGAVALRHN
jgi:hypothetical protein